MAVTSRHLLYCSHWMAMTSFPSVDAADGLVWSICQACTCLVRRLLSVFLHFQSRRDILRADDLMWPHIVQPLKMQPACQPLEPENVAKCRRCTYVSIQASTVSQDWRPSCKLSHAMNCIREVLRTNHFQLKHQLNYKQRVHIKIYSSIDGAYVPSA